MLSVEKRIEAFISLGKVLKLYNGDAVGIANKQSENLFQLITESHLYNRWFTEENVRQAILSIGLSLEEQKIRKWLRSYDLGKIKEAKRVGVVMAGNIPLVGFFDFLCILISGHTFVGKLSTDDQKLLPAIAEILVDLESGFKKYIEFTEEKLAGFDAIIATGSNNTARYFEYYFGKYPRIIRKNRNGVAVFSGNESRDELTGFGRDVFLYFGLGCRNVSKVFVPAGYKFDAMFEAFEDYHKVIDHFKYKNNYDYYKTIFLINRTPHFDNGFLLVKEDPAYSSPPSILYFEEYEDLSKLKNRLKTDQEKIQCFVSSVGDIEDSIAFGQSQNPELWDYADGVDTMKFLMQI